MCRVQGQHRGNERRHHEEAPVDGNPEREAQKAHQRGFRLERTVEIPFVVELRDALSQRVGRGRRRGLAQTKLCLGVDSVVERGPRVRTHAIGHGRMKDVVHAADPMQVRVLK
jgi:hypothetical protein